MSYNNNNNGNNNNISGFSNSDILNMISEGLSNLEIREHTGASLEYINKLRKRFRPDTIVYDIDNLRNIKSVIKDIHKQDKIERMQTVQEDTTVTLAMASDSLKRLMRTIMITEGDKSKYLNTVKMLNIITSSSWESLQKSTSAMPVLEMARGEDKEETVKGLRILEKLKD